MLLHRLSRAAECVFQCARQQGAPYVPRVAAVDNAQRCRIAGYPKVRVKQRRVGLNCEIVVAGGDKDGHAIRPAHIALPLRRVVQLVPDARIELPLAEHADTSRRRTARRLVCIDGRAQQQRAAKPFRLRHHVAQRAEAAHRDAADHPPGALRRHGVVHFDLGQEIVEESGLHLFLAIHVPIRAALRHHDRDRRDIAVFDQRVDRALQMALGDPVIRVAIVAVQEIDDRNARRVRTIAGRQIKRVGPVASERGRMEASIRYRACKDEAPQAAQRTASTECRNGRMSG